ncbi:MAG TPA: aldehyde dehydrogenase family protein, partial [Cytophagaceae bacterium]
SNVPGCALAIENVFIQAGFPAHVFQTILCDSKQVAEIIKSPVIKAVTLTGSEGAGAAVASQAGREIKKTVLELGGSDPFIILSDADLEQAAEVAVQSRMINSGQSCIAAKRFIVEEKVYDSFIKLFKAKVSRLIVGDPMDEATEVGPMAREDLAQEIMRQIKDSVQKGAEILVGGDRPALKGAYINPTILVNVKKGVPAYEEEIFGPVASIIKVKDVQEAIVVANDSSFGLGASIWTKDSVKARELARQIEAGSVFVNGMVKSDPRLPFGGIKKSGYGRELSYQGIREFVNIKTIWIK